MRVAAALSKRQDTFSEDLESLEGTMANARNPPGLLSVKLREMDEGTFVAKAGGKGGGGAGGKAGDWECPSCGANVFASKNACFKCGATKDSGRGGGRDRDRDRREDRRDDRDDRRGGGRYDDDRDDR